MIEVASLSIYEIRDKALKSGRAVYTPQQLSHLTGKSVESARVYMSRLVAKNLAQKVMRGRISFTDNDYVVATQLIEPAYVSLDTALLFHGISKQVTKYIETVTTVNSKLFEGLGINYHKIDPALFFGYERHLMGQSYAFISTPEKAIIDGLYLRIYSASQVKEYEDSLDIVQLKGIIGKIDSKYSKRLKAVVSLLKKTF